MDPSNFGVDEHGNTVLVDFGDIAMLPESFAAYALSSCDNLIARSLGLSRNSNRPPWLESPLVCGWCLTMNSVR